MMPIKMHIWASVHFLRPALKLCLSHEGGYMCLYMQGLTGVSDMLVAFFPNVSLCLFPCAPLRLLFSLFQTSLHIQGNLYQGLLVITLL